MTAARCEHCGHYWAHNAGQRFLYITRFCPNCIPHIGHRYP
jgi:phage FluMu protein Com